jgi:hypothetical protein
MTRLAWLVGEFYDGIEAGQTRWAKKAFVGGGQGMGAAIDRPAVDR